MRQVKVKQGTLDWEKLRERRIGSSEIYDIVRYYATDTELQNCGINAEDFRAEKPFTTVWALYHKMLDDGLYNRASVAAEDAEYGHAAEPYGVYLLQKSREHKITPGKVFISDRLIASLDASGIAEECDTNIAYVNGTGSPRLGDRFVCEQKTIRPELIKKGVPYKYIIQAQYQVLQTEADFFILQVMTLDEDTAFIRGKICQMSRKKRFEYFGEHLKVSNLYFRNNPHLSALIDVCIKRFFDAVDNQIEPKAFIENDLQSNIIESIRLNSLYNDSLQYPAELSAYIAAKEYEELAKAHKNEELQKLIEIAKANNICRFVAADGTTAVFSKNGRFLVRPPKEASA